MVLVLSNQMLALASIDTILGVDYEQTWLNHMIHRGYLQHIVDSLLHDNEQLQPLLLPNPEPLRALYIFQSKIVRFMLFYHSKKA